MHRLQGAAASDARASERATCGRGYGTLVSRKVGKLIREPLRFYVIATLGNNSKVFIVELFRSTTRTAPFLFLFQPCGCCSNYDDAIYRLPPAYGVIETRLINDEQTTAKNKRGPCLGAA